MAKQTAAKQETERLRRLVNVPQQGTPQRSETYARGKPNIPVPTKGISP